MNEEAIAGPGILFLILVVAGVLLAVLWIVMPFYMISINNKLASAIKLLKEANAGRSEQFDELAALLREANDRPSSETVASSLDSESTGA